MQESLRHFWTLRELIIIIIIITTTTTTRVAFWDPPSGSKTYKFRNTVNETMSENEKSILAIER